MIIIQKTYLYVKSHFLSIQKTYTLAAVLYEDVYVFKGHDFGANTERLCSICLDFDLQISQRQLRLLTVPLNWT